MPTSPRMATSANSPPPTNSANISKKNKTSRPRTTSSASAQATLTSSSRKLEQISADYRQKLQAERADNSDKLDKTQAEVTKQQYRNGLLELKAPQDGIIKDLATHTIGTVISPGTILMTLVPKDEILRAEVWVSNEDVGFIHLGEPTKIKFASYQFQKYGMVDGKVAHLSADATDNTQQGAGQSAPPPSSKSPNGQPFSYRALVDLKAQELIVDGVKPCLESRHASHGRDTPWHSNHPRIPAVAGDGGVSGGGERGDDINRSCCACRSMNGYSKA